MPETAALDLAVKAVLKRPFAEQVAFFRAKLGRLLPTERWTDVWKEQHDRAFMVAGAQKADLLADLASAVDKAIAGGESIDAFRKRFSGIVQRHGWTGYRGAFDWRTRVIYATNLSTSYAAGRLAQLRQGGFPFWVYRHSDSVAHPRPQHVAWDGLTLPAGHPFWKTHYPPSGWGCRCYVLGARDAKGARRLGGDPGKALPGGWDAIDPKTGEPPGIDRGWGYMPGGTVSDTVRTMAKKTVQWPYETGKAYMTGVPADTRDALARAIRTQPETGEVVRRYAERALGERNGAPIDPLAAAQPYQTMGLLTTEEAAQIARMTGVDAVERELYDWTIDAYAPNHILGGHGDDAIEATSGQRAVTAADFGRVPEIIAGADRIEAAGKSRSNKNPLVRLYKRIGKEEYVTVFEVRAGRRMLALDTMYIIKRRP